MALADEIRKVLADPSSLPAEFWSYTIQHRAQNPVPSGSVEAPILASTGLVGATSPSRYVGATTSGAPAAGTFQVGDFVVDQSGKVWICSVAGSPGTWAAANAPVASVFGRTGAVIGQTGDFSQLGYATGQGGSVTQATSQTTDVTLNTICGQIQTFNAALAAGAAVIFNVNNSLVAATDVVIVSATITVSVTSACAAGGGSFQVRYENNGGGTTFTGFKINFAVIKAVAA